MPVTTLNAISPIDGRYADKTNILNIYFSEQAFIYYRLLVEVRWLQSLAAHPQITELDAFSIQDNQFLENLLDHFDEADALKIKQFEKETNHDVKAIEYFLTHALQQHSSLQPAISFIHFACTSEDINNLAYALMLKNSIQQIILPQLKTIMVQLTAIAHTTAEQAMLAYTHGQAATPTTMGKELINIVARLQRPFEQLMILPYYGKCNGAVGNYNAHIAAYPTIDWPTHCQKFVEALGLTFNPYTTQIEPHDGVAELAHLMMRINTIFLDYTRDIWTYISLHYFKQKTIDQEIGSSTMPHKVNPIDFENAEGNLGLANALFAHFANKLPQSRLQRDLSDSTVLRNLGVAFAHTLIALHSLEKGNNKLELNADKMHADLNAHWELLAEPIQTMMRRYQLPNAYAQLKDATRGKCITQQHIQEFINALNLPAEAKQRLLTLTPTNYLGLANYLVKHYT